jgi:hypothetical protein
LGTFNVSVCVSDDHYFRAFETASELTRGPVAGDAGQLVAVVVIVGKGSAHPVSPQRMSPELDLGSETNVARQETHGGWLWQLLQRLEELRNPRADLTSILLKAMIEQKDISIEEMPDVPGTTLQAIAQEELPDECRIGAPMEMSAFGYAGHAIEQFGRPTEGVHAGSSGPDEGAINVEQYQSGHGELEKDF